MKPTAVKSKQINLLLGDFLFMFLALAGMVALRYPIAQFQLIFWQHLGPITFVFLCWLVIFYGNGLYDLRFVKPSLAFYRRFFESWLLALGVAIALFYLIPFLRITPKTNLIMLSLVFAGLFLLWRATVSLFLGQTSRLRTLVVAPTQEIRELLTVLTRNPLFGYEIVGVIDESNGPRVTGLTYFPNTTPLRALTNENSIQLIIVGNENQNSKLHQELYELIFWNVAVMRADLFFESLTGRVPLTALSETWFFENLRSEHARVYETTHVIIDYFLSLVGLVFLIILTPVVALLTKLSSPGPVFFRQERVGLNGKTFSVIKFRTMLALSKDGSAELAGAQFSTPNDTRVTTVGKIIRQLRIDELPQVINILRGEMSLIGPRPERPAFVYEFERHMPFYAVRSLVKPGLTGWAQVNFPYAESLEEHMIKFQYDLYYLKNRSFFLDLAVILKTFHVISYRKGR